MFCLLSLRFLSLFLANIATARVTSRVFLSTSASIWRNIKQNIVTLMFSYYSLPKACLSDKHRINTVQNCQESTLTILTWADHQVTSCPCFISSHLWSCKICKTWLEYQTQVHKNLLNEDITSKSTVVGELDLQSIATRIQFGTYHSHSLTLVNLIWNRNFMYIGLVNIFSS